MYSPWLNIDPVPPLWSNTELLIVRLLTLSAYRPDDIPTPLEYVIRLLRIFTPLIGP